MGVTGDTPECQCHGEPQKRCEDDRIPKGFYWRCAVRQREHDRAYRARRYGSLDGRAYNYMLLQHRRHKALVRRREREAASG